MTAASLLAVILSCFSHTAWNLIAKRANATPTFFWLANLCVVALVAPAFLWLFAGSLFAIPPKVFLCLLVTGLCLTGYYLSLSRAYREADISLVYPLVRCGLIFVIPLSGFLQGTWPSRQAILGVVLTVAGCFLLPGKSLPAAEPGEETVEEASEARDAETSTPMSTTETKDTGWRARLPAAAVGWAFLAALSSSGYTVADAIGVNALKPVAEGVRGAFFYACLEWVSIVLFLGVPVLAGDFRGAVREVWQRDMGRAVAVGVLDFVTYMLVLFAYSLSSNVAYVAGLRQLSIVLSVLGGVLFFRDRIDSRRGAGAVIIMAGLALIALAR